MVDDLPAALGEAIVLRECNGMSYKEIAEATGVAVSTAMSRIAQARTLLLAARRAANKAVQASRMTGLQAARRS
jgi:RNA polymerase sigma-70 factor (ECF subfamily)